ncbi:hypothetical protein [Pseudaquabacterium rugosum]|uniref:Histidine kinase n=1 Tax=Pseudaquabacterium rugosum TaxID=2984194 RepID=A0ABU9B3K5_9BURK
MPGSEPLLPRLTLLMARLGAAVAGPLTDVAERLAQMTQSGQVSRRGLQALQIQVEQVRRRGIDGQQMARLIEGQALSLPEAFDLTALTREALIETLGQGEHSLHPWQLTVATATAARADPALCAVMVRRAVAWSAGLARQEAGTHWTIADSPADAASVELCCERLSAAHPGDPAKAEAAEPATDTALDWLMLTLAADMVGATVTVDDERQPRWLTLRLPRATAADQAWAPPMPRTSAALRRPPLAAGSQLLVLARGRDTRQQVREALHGLDVFVDYVPTVEAAQTYFRDSLPRVMLFESAYAGAALHALCHRLRTDDPSRQLVEILPQGRLVERLQQADPPRLRIGVDALKAELARTLGEHTA